MRAFALVLLAAGSMDIPLDHQAITDALTIANSSLEPSHVRFHASYQIPAGTPPVDFISIVTPFRKVVLAAETAARLGRRMFGQRDALAALRPDPASVEIYAELTFHPHNTFIGIPDYSIELEPISSPGSAILPIWIDRLSRFSPRLESPWYPFPYPSTQAPQPPSGAQPLMGGTLVARFAGEGLNPRGVYAVVVKDGKKELTRGQVDFARVR